MIRRLALLALLLPACPGDKNDATSDSASTGDSGTDGTVGMSSTPTTSATADSTTATDSGNATADPDPSATADPPGDPCTTLCNRLAACMVDSEPGCFEGCSEDLDDSEGECRDATIAWLSCLEGLDCAELKATFEDDAPSGCDAQLDNVEVECSDGVCSFNGGGGQDECEASVECRGEPLRAMKCDSVTCTCFEGDEPTGMDCPADGICMNLDALQDKSFACCGF